MSAQKTKIHLSGLARRLVWDKFITEEQALQAQEDAHKNKIPLTSFLVNNNIIKSYHIALSASQEFGVPLLDIDAVEIDHEIVNLLKNDLIERHHALPLHKRGTRLFVAVSDPTNLQALDEIKFATGLATEAIVVEDDKLSKVIKKFLEATDTSMSDMLDDDLENLDIESGFDEPSNNDDPSSDSDDAPVVKYVNKILLDAINKGASDIHVEPYEKIFRIRFRQDGVLQEVANPPLNLTNRLVSRLKVMSKMDIAERRVPQDGRIKMRLSKNKAIDFRVNSCPTLFGEKIVLRILDPTSAQIGIEALGFEEEQQKLYLEAIHKPYGMVLVTGPTGSGKTVSLYTALNILNTVDRNISTSEDPVEINVTGINQVHINNKAGLTFAESLRAFLRQDPDIIMVGEIRDLETAEISIKAAQTGHLVMSTLHTNDAPQTLTRLANMGVPAYNIASAVHMILAQRLARRLCNKCKKEVELPAEALLEEGFKKDDLDDLKIYAPIGCESCAKGYKGRVGIYQVMPISEEMGKMIMEGRNALDLAVQAKKEGIDDLRTSGLKKVASGLTSIEEINRITKD
ncbi:MAG: type IV-A pilus assembly ATPase PilB [Methylococcales bacterium]|jgi:type IV pilus assembly protein PilB|nr:type IV-A pilus assembly ATPase PilB [Methylococcales bacterium]MBT7409089.1 type IV-A pilus assembly ATPase PilB [Methylococcales bacterium]